MTKLLNQLEKKEGVLTIKNMKKKFINTAHLRKFSHVLKGSTEKSIPYLELIKSHWTLKYIHGNTLYIYVKCDAVLL